MMVEVKDGKIAVEGAIVLYQGGVEVARVDAVYDVRAVPEDLLGALPLHRVHFGLPTKHELDEIIEGAQRRRDYYTERMTIWKAMPWWRRLFARHPRPYDEPQPA